MFVSENVFQFVSRFELLSSEREAGIKLDCDQIAHSVEKAILRLGNKHDSEGSVPLWVHKYTGKGSRSSSSKNTGEGSRSSSFGKNSLVGVCQAYQTVKFRDCFADNCHFEHKKLSAEDAQELIQKVQSKGRTGNKEVPVKPDLEKPEKKSTSSGKNLLGLCELPSETARMARTELTERELTKDDISCLADELERRRNG